MPDIDVQRAHAAPPERMRAVAREALEVLAPRYGLFVTWRGPDRAEVTGKGVNGLLRLEPGRLRATAELPWMFRLAAMEITEQVGQRLDLLIRDAQEPVP